ncbi:Gibberellin-regulated protein 12 [Ananas comosus]|uniref:Gibberellin-regulated protein 12 n=1 Tax=Ananas comosus TaxID=4615 RepID=A0A199VC47_ANACO|nr:Gibberellin-regulated protein 12 [Ananas comosus]
MPLNSYSVTGAYIYLSEAVSASQIRRVVPEMNRDRSPKISKPNRNSLAEIIGGANASHYLPTGGEGSVPPEECPVKCEYRCSATSHKKPCLFFCNECCQKCHCVPSGTYGHKEECPCYNNWKTKEGKPKCP